MLKTKLWYWKQNGKVTGPFTEGLIQQYIILKRIHPDDLMSQDKNFWRKVSSIPSLIPDVIKHKADENYSERLKAAVRWADDRSDLRDKVDTNFSHRNKTTHIAIPTLGLKTLLLFFTLIALGVWSAFYFTPGKPTEKINCQAALLKLTTSSSLTKPVDKLIFDGCDLSGENLSALDLKNASFKNTLMQNTKLQKTIFSYSQMQYSDLNKSNLSGAKLDHSNLTAAILSDTLLYQADFTNANLSYANLKGAKANAINLSGAKLSKAVWFNGEICAMGSIGRCLISKKIKK